MKRVFHYGPSIYSQGLVYSVLMPSNGLISLPLYIHWVQQGFIIYI